MDDAFQILALLVILVDHEELQTWNGQLVKCRNGLTSEVTLGEHFIRVNLSDTQIVDQRQFSETTHGAQASFLIRSICRALEELVPRLKMWS